MRSNGRLNWGSGKSSSLTKQMAFQNDLSTMHDEWLEALEIIPRMWREDVFSFQGHFFNFPPTLVIPKRFNSHTRRCLRACSKPDTAAYVGQLRLGALNFAIGSDDYLSEKVREYRLSIAQAKPNGHVPNNSFSCTPVTLVLNNDRKACPVWISRCPVFCGHGDNPLPKRHAPDRPT